MMLVSFEDARLYVEKRESVLFFARVGEDRVACYVPRATLVRHFGARDDAANAYKFCLCAFDRNTETIRAIAAQAVSQRRHQTDGSVLVGDPFSAADLKAA